MILFLVNCGLTASYLFIALTTQHLLDQVVFGFLTVLWAAVAILNLPSKKKVCSDEVVATNNKDILRTVVPSMDERRRGIYDEIEQERISQQYFTPADWDSYLDSLSEEGGASFRERMVKMAALAIAGIEVIDRRTGDKPC